MKPSVKNQLERLVFAAVVVGAALLFAIPLVAQETPSGGLQDEAADGDVPTGVPRSC